MMFIFISQHFEVDSFLVVLPLLLRFYFQLHSSSTLSITFSNDEHVFPDKSFNSPILPKFNKFFTFSTFPVSNFQSHFRCLERASFSSSETSRENIRSQRSAGQPSPQSIFVHLFYSSFFSQSFMHQLVS